MILPRNNNIIASRMVSRVPYFRLDIKSIKRKEKIRRILGLPPLKNNYLSPGVYTSEKD